MVGDNLRLVDVDDNRPTLREICRAIPVCGVPSLHIRRKRNENRKRSLFAYDVGKNVRQLVGLSSKSPNLLTASAVSPYVKAIRKEYASSMQTSNLKKALPSLSKLLNQLVITIEARRTEGAIDFQHLLVRFALDVIGAVAFDTTLGGMDGSGNIPELMIEVGHIFKERLFDPITTTCYKLFPRLEGARKRQRAIDRLTQEYDKITKEILQREAPSDGSRPLWFGLRSCYHSETDVPMSYDSLRAEVALVILGGTGTSAHQLAWLFSVLAEHPRVVDKILEELRERGLYGDGAREVVFEDLGELPYLTAVIKEGMRIAYIVASTRPSVVPHDTTLMGYRVPRGTLVVIPGTRWIGTEKELGDPDVFRPERWLTDEDMSHVHYLGFSYGPRDCAGQRLAMMEMRLVLIKLLTQFRFETVIPFDELMLNGKNGVVIESAEGIPLNVVLRTVS